MKIAISGCLGRMGQRIAHLAGQDSVFQITTLLEREGYDGPKESNGIAIQTDPEAIKGCDVLIEFTTPQATLVHLKTCQKHGVRMVIGTTGMTPAQVEKIKAASQDIGIVYSANMSIGVNIVFKMLQILASTAPENYAVTMSEAHHVQKKDAPSGTAKMLQNIVEQNSRHTVGNIESIREGEIIGDHSVVFESNVDQITIAHHAKTRDIFVVGALKATKFLKDKPSGLFDMQDVLGLK